ncbi:hypothetical protein HHI36_017239 [Cryptolaemus montrouzieri]|uniref:MATH domain-containing protein n=1 Tax=Cryptolaemus montrouzieri TaxID=559131 RepID=A0ABD2NM92_9CUCU
MFTVQFVDGVLGYLMACAPTSSCSKDGFLQLTEQLDTRFQELEIKIIQELELIKEALHLQSNKKRSDLKQIPNPSIDYEGYPSEIERNSRINEKYILSDDELDEIKPIFSSFKTIDQKRSDNDQNNIEPIFPTMKKPKLKLKNGMESVIPVSTDVATEKPIFWSARVNRETISQLNNTIQTTDNGNIYHYFWQVENFNNLMNKMELYIRSSPFLVLGHELMIQLHPNQPKQNFLFIKLQTPNGFLMKHKFYILQRAHKGQNIESHFLGNLGGKDKFVIPKQLILNSGSLSNGSIIIKLSIFLK